MECNYEDASSSNGDESPLEISLRFGELEAFDSLLHDDKEDIPKDTVSKVENI